MAFRLYWEDNNGKGSRNTFWLPEGLTVPEMVARANILRNAARPLSNARIVRGELVVDELLPRDPGPAGPSDVRTNLVLLFRDLRGASSLRVPSPGAIPLDLSGPYAFQRVTRENLDQAGLLAGLEAALDGLLFPWQDPAPNTFVVGSLDFTE